MNIFISILLSSLSVAVNLILHQTLSGAQGAPLELKNRYICPSCLRLLSLLHVSDVRSEVTANWWTQPLDPAHPLIQHWRVPSSIIHLHQSLAEFMVSTKAVSVPTSKPPPPPPAHTSHKGTLFALHTHTQTQKSEKLRPSFSLNTHHYGSSTGYRALYFPYRNEAELIVPCVSCWLQIHSLC